jgi:hypothetical protein
MDDPNKVSLQTSERTVGSWEAASIICSTVSCGFRYEVRSVFSSTIFIQYNVVGTTSSSIMLNVLRIPVIWIIQVRVCTLKRRPWFTPTVLFLVQICTIHIGQSEHRKVGQFAFVTGRPSRCVSRPSTLGSSEWNNYYKYITIRRGPYVGLRESTYSISQGLSLLIDQSLRHAKTKVRQRGHSKSKNNGLPSTIMMAALLHAMQSARP